MGLICVCARLLWAMGDDVECVSSSAAVVNLEVAGMTETTAGKTPATTADESADANILQPANADSSGVNDPRKHTFGFLAALDPFAKLAGEVEEVDQSEKRLAAWDFADEAEPGMNLDEVSALPEEEDMPFDMQEQFLSRV